jgi:virginiamycin B lyase
VSGKRAAITARAIVVALFAVGEAGAGPYGTAAGPDGAVWVTLVHGGAIARVMPGGDVEVFPLGAPDARPSLICAGRDGALWFTRSGDDRIGRIAVDGSLTSYALAEGSAPFGIAAGPDGAVWFTTMGTDRIGRIAPDGAVEELPIPGARGAMPSMLTVGPDGALWFTLNQANAVGRLEIAAGSFTVRELPTRDAGPVGICATHDAVWFTEILAGQLGRVTPDGPVQELPLPDRESRPHAVIPGQADGVWVTLWGADRVAHVSDQGELAELALPPGSEPHGLVVGADGALWVALESGHVARFTGN